MASVDLNADLGESFGTWQLGDDDAMLGLVTSANVACGFHAGDPATLSHSCEEAAKQGVRIGAQVGYPDRAGFGRRFIDVTPSDLIADVIYQIGALQALARAAGSGCRIRETAWRAVQHDRQPPRPGPRGRQGCAHRRPNPAGARIGGIGLLRRGGATRPAHRARGVRRPLLPARRTARLPAGAQCRAARPRRDRRPGGVDGAVGARRCRRRIDDLHHRRIRLCARRFAGSRADRHRGAGPPGERRRTS